MHFLILHFRLSFGLCLHRVCLHILKVEVLEASCSVGFPLMVCFLLPEVDGLNLIDLVVTGLYGLVGLALSDERMGVLPVWCLHVYFEISRWVSFTRRISNGMVSTRGLPVGGIF